VRLNSGRFSMYLPAHVTLFGARANIVKRG
jgi:hypothetical protein